MQTVLCISIHAPSRERPSPLIFCACANGISIHAPSRERRLFSVRAAHTLGFQSTLPRGSDHIPLPALAALVDFNPRSLAGATLPPLAPLTVSLISIHAPSRERHVFQTFSDFVAVFQSTLPRGSDIIIRVQNKLRHNFNPRSLAGATRRKLASSSAPEISIHAPSRERLCHNRNAPRSKLFQSTLPRGSDRNDKGRRTAAGNFNPRSLAGATNI